VLGFLLEVGVGWGFGLAVRVERAEWAAPGSFGWNGGTGTLEHMDPENGLIGILLTQRMLDSPEPPAIFQDFLTHAHRAISH